MLKSIRVTLAVISFIAVTLLFTDVTGFAVSHWGWMAKIQFIPAVLSLNFAVVGILLLLTLVMGRVYCSVICPLGILQDIINWFRGKTGKKQKRKNRFKYEKAHTVIRLGFMIAFVLLLLGGLTSIASLIEPYSEFGRIASQLVRPLGVELNNVAADISWAHGSGSFLPVTDAYFSIVTFSIALVTFIVILIMAWRGGREYCNTVCPVGTILGYIGKFALLRPMIDTTKCNGCTKCARNCKARCIDAKEHAIDYSRCVVCMDCIGNCSQAAISYRYAYGRKQENNKSDIDSVRRQFLGVGMILAASAASHAQRKLTDGGMAKLIDKHNPPRKSPIVPPGAQSIRNLTEHCTACQLCVSACPSHIIRPSNDLETLMQPRLDYDRGYCRPECTKCSDVCPTGAIIPLESCDKSGISIGRAVVDLDLCLAANWAKEDGGNPCHGCERHCPAGAISMIAVDKDQPEGKLMPVVNEGLCIGCGACEHLCPVNPVSAIRVSGYEIHRSI